MTAEQTAPFYWAAIVLGITAILVGGALKPPKAGGLRPWVDSGK